MYLNQPYRACKARIIFSRMVRSPKIPSSFLSSGHSAIPFLRNSRERMVIRRPFIVQRDPCRDINPKDQIGHFCASGTKKACNPNYSHWCISKSMGSTILSGPDSFNSTTVFLLVLSSLVLAFDLSSSSYSLRPSIFAMSSILGGC